MPSTSSPEEVAAVRAAVGLFEATGYAKYEVGGPGARAWLDRVLANTIPRAGRLALSPMLNAHGKIIGDFTVGCLEDGIGTERFMIFGSGPAQQYHERWFRQHLDLAFTSGPGADVSLRVCGPELTGLSIAGPNARAVLDELTDFDVSNEAFGFLDFRDTWVGRVPCMVGRVTFTGDLGFEIWCTASYQPQLFDALTEIGSSYGMRLFGGRALDSLRLDKAWGSWGTEYRPIYDPDEANMGWMVKVDDPAKGDFIGRDAAAAAKASGPVTETDHLRHGCRNRRRRGGLHRQRADLARRCRRRMDHLRWVRPPQSDVGGDGVRTGRDRRQ